MKLLIVLGSPRRRGNSEILAEEVVKGLADVEVEYLRLNDLNIRPCQGCGGCEKTGICVIADDMTDLYAKVDAADSLLLVSPVYFYGLTGQTKIFIDRCQSLWSRRYLLKDSHRIAEGRRGYLLSVAATNGEKLFDCSMLTVRYFFDAAGYHYEDSLLVPGVDAKGDILQRPVALQDARDFGEKMFATRNDPLI
ncbi:flavodoxin family protein [Desulfotalea psychrophila]|nr:flavodoxin family protein [Desulfotalea psychrophila]